MNAWEIWTGNVYGPHPVVIVSNQKRVERKDRVVVMKCVTLRPGQPWNPDALQSVLDQEDGLQLRTRCDCDLFYTIEKATLSQKRGEVSWERRRDISRKMLQALAFQGL
jgi:mRNA-degrading endonuclease toxin of MazEF toxin-antitoxin module